MSTTVVPQSRPLATPEADLYGEIDALCQLVRLGQDRFTLALIEYDLPRTCAKIISDLREEFSSLNIVEAELSSPPPDAPLSYNVLDQLKQVVQATSPDKPPDVLILTGLQVLFPPSVLTDNGHMSDELRRALQPLNLGRNILAEMFPCPVLLFLPRAAMEILLTSAPDIVSWKSGFFLFESDLEKVRAKLDREADIEFGWLARWRLRRLTPEELTHETKRLATLIGDARMLPAEPKVIARLHNRMGWTAVALGDSTMARQSFAEMLRLARCENDAKLIKMAEKGLRQAEKLQWQQRISLKRSAITQQSFRGAAALSKADGLFGRETELQELLLQINRVGNRFVTVWGETGCGKTSLVLAGVVPELEKQGQLSVIIREWEHPASALRKALESECDLSLSPSASLRDWLQAAVQKTNKTIVIVCDQFEQFFTKHPNRQEREPLLKEIGACLNDFRLPCKFIFILREDYLGRMVELEKSVADTLDRSKRFYLSLFDQGTALRVLHQLSDKARLNWPNVFLNEVIKDLTEDGQVRPIELQLVGAALATLNINDEQAYSRAGRADGLLTDYLQATLESVSENKSELQTLKRVLLALIEEPHERLSLTVEEIAARSEVNLSRVGDKLNKLSSVNLVRRHAELEENKVNNGAIVFLYDLMHDVLVDSVLRLTRDIQDKRRQAKKTLTRALEDVRVKPRHTINLGEHRLLRNYLSATDKDNPKVKALLNRSLLFGIVKWITLGLLAPLSLLIFVQSTFTHITIERDFSDRLTIRRGLPQLGFLPLIGDDILIDTGFTVNYLNPEKRSVVQEIYAWELDNRRGGAIAEKRFYESVGYDSSAIQSALLIKIGYKNKGLPQLLTVFREAPKYTFDRKQAAYILATAIKADPSLARPAFDTLLASLKESKGKNDYFNSSTAEDAADTLAVAIKADPSLARPAFDTLLAFLKESKYEINTNALIAAIKADPSLAKPAFDTLLLILKNSRNSLLIKSEPLIEMAEAAMKADSSLVRPAFDASLIVFKDNKDEEGLFFDGSQNIVILAAAIKADPSLLTLCLLLSKETNINLVATHWIRLWRQL
jgi:predicted transcriptional regulator